MLLRAICSTIRAACSWSFENGVARLNASRHAVIREHPAQELDDAFVRMNGPLDAPLPKGDQKHPRAPGQR